MNYKVDNLDMKILSRLLNNCRESNRQIGKELGVSGSAVQARIKKMIGNGVIEKFFIKIEPQIFECSVLYIVVPDGNKEVAKQIEFVGEPNAVVPCIGGVTVYSIIIKEKTQKKIELVNELIKDVRVLTVFEAEDPGFTANLTKTDLDILGELNKNPRQKNEIIAKNINMSTKTVTRCIEKFQQNNGIQFTLIFNPTKMNNFIPYAIFARVEGKLKETLEDLNGTFEEVYLQIPFITKNQIMLIMYTDSVFKMDEITQKVRVRENIRSADLFIPKKILYDNEWLEEAIAGFKKSPKLHLDIREIK